MNIFILDNTISESVKCYVDSHASKIVLELAQMLCTSHRVLSSNEEKLNPVIYKKAHVNHPCTKWMRQTKGNYLWSYEMFSALSSEYSYRYKGRVHLSWSKLKDILVEPPELIDPSSERTPFALAMPNECKSMHGDAVNSYRNYYNAKKTHLFKWTKRPVPSWIDSQIDRENHATV